MGIVILLIFGALAIGVAGWMWRINLAINHPEKYRRLRAWEEEERKQRKKAMAEAARAGLKAARLDVKVARFLSKK